MTIDDLYKREGWVVFTYPDGSKRVIRTTLNQEVLAAVKPAPSDDFLFDLDKLFWVPLPTKEEVQVAVYEQRPVLSEVDEFVNRFV